MKIGGMIKKSHNSLKLLGFKLRFRLFGLDYALIYLNTCESALAPRMLRYLGARIGEHTIIETPIIINSGERYLLRNLKIGDHCYIGKNVLLDVKGNIDIGDRVTISMNSAILSHIDLGEYCQAGSIYKTSYDRTVIGDDSYLGAQVTVANGVQIGKFCIVASGAVAIEDVQSATLVAGVPALPKRKITIKIEGK